MPRSYCPVPLPQNINKIVVGRPILAVRTSTATERAILGWTADCTVRAHRAPWRILSRVAAIMHTAPIVQVIELEGGHRIVAARDHHRTAPGTLLSLPFPGGKPTSVELLGEDMSEHGESRGHGPRSPGSCDHIPALQEECGLVATPSDAPQIPEYSIQVSAALENPRAATITRDAFSCAQIGSEARGWILCGREPPIEWLLVVVPLCSLIGATQPCCASHSSWTRCTSAWITTWMLMRRWIVVA